MDDIPNIENLANRDEILGFILARRASADEVEHVAFAGVVSEALRLLEASGAHFFLADDNPNAFCVELEPARKSH